MSASETLTVDVDGVRLHTELLLPSGKHRVPTLLVRTPYDLRSHTDEARGWVARGFGFAVQDVRGRHRSDGIWEPYRHEGGDGWATVDRLADHPRVGVVVAYGGSYAAGTARAIRAHPAVIAMISAVPATGLRQTIIGAEGIAHLERHAWWWSAHGESRTSRPGALNEVLRASPSLFDRLPVTEAGTMLGLRRFAAAMERAGREPDEEAHDIAVPSLHLGGWWDPFVDTTWAHCQPLGGQSTVIIGPWGHDLHSKRPLGVLPANPRASLPLGRLQADWLTRTLAGEPLDTGRVWVGGDRGWITPRSRTSQHRWELDLRGRLVPEGDAGPETALRFDHDPATPLPGLCWPVDVSADQDHPDCRRFRSVPLREPLTLFGTPDLTAEYSTELRPGASTDIAVRLSRELEDGSVIPLSYGIRETAASAEPRRVKVPMRPVGVTVARGERLIIDLSGSFFPRHARNPQLPGTDRLHTTRLSPLRRWLTVGAGATTLHLPVVDE